MEIHCDALTQQCDAGMASYAERVAEMECDMDELSGKYIEASEKLEQWDLWWQEASTQAREAETTVRHPEGLTTIAEEERRSQPTTAFVQSQPTIPQEFLPPPLPPKFAHKNFPERANESDESSHTGMDPQALPTFAPTTPPSAPKHIRPAMGTTGSSQQIGAQQGRITSDEVRKDRSPLPKLAIKGGDATTLTRVINEWIQKTTISLNTWSQSAATFWAQVVGMARQRHNWWLSLSPDQRAMHIGLPTTGQTIPLQLPILEATMRAELLNNVLPERVQTTSMQRGATTVLDLLFITFQTYLPSEPSARVEGLTTVEAPLRASKNFQEARH